MASGHNGKDYYPFFFLTEMEGNREDLSQIGECWVVLPDDLKLHGGGG